MEFRLLGPLKVLHEGREVVLVGSGQRALLALMLVHANETLPADGLIRELWDGSPPENAAETLRTHVSGLRDALPGDAGELIVTRGHSYELRLEPDQLDSKRFERLVADARSELAGGRPERAASVLEEGLSLWRGPPLADVAAEPFAQSEIDRLDELRRAAHEYLVEARRALGGRAETILGEAHASTPPARALDELPTGVVTFVLTDIEGSSALWEADPDGMAAALQLHDDMIARAMQAHRGRVLKTKGEGDATVTVFRRASDAVAGAVSTQEALSAAPWPDGLELLVRVAVHTGEAQERDHDYFGPALNRAARLRGLARGGATVMSQATAEIVQDRLPRDVELVPIGRHQLRGLSRPENVFELRPARASPSDAVREMRKTITVLFASVGASVPDGRRLDPEVRRRILSPYVQNMRAVLERHGGAVETWPGDALMAVFGVPVLHEDDALRAVRAAAEMRDGPAGVGDDLERAFDVRASTRVGVGTGEVIAPLSAAGQPVATGEAVTVAKRLEELAGAGEILIDEQTHRLVRGCVDAEPVADRPSRSGDPIGAVRVLDVRTGMTTRRASRLHSPLVGRDRQLGALTTQLAAAITDRACHLVTVLGAAGVGKSRLVQEFTGGLGDGATVLRGRCLPYGEGITYWPLADVVRDLIEARDPGAPSLPALAARLAGEPKADVIVDGLAEALGLADSKGGTSEKIFWAVRRLLEAVARERPLVVVFDDLQWAEPTFLDLLEHVTDLSRNAPLVVLCIARPELLDARPGWGGGKLNASSILLQPLSADETIELITNLLNRATLPPEAAARIAEATEGNPLFAEELLAMLIEEGLLRRIEQGWTVADEPADLPVPPTIHALLAARLEGLPDDERALLAHASVEGTVFHRGALGELAPPSLVPFVERALTSLVRRDMIRPERASVGDDEAYGFRHVLIRDAAYRSLPKETRSELHERFAAWVVEVAGPRLGEFQEFVGYHLEQAYLNRRDLGMPDSEVEAVAVRAAEHLERAGRRAVARSDHSGAVSLLERAARLLPDEHERRARLLPDLGAELIEAGRLPRAREVLDEASRVATAAGDESAAARALVQKGFLRLRGESAGTAEAAAVVEQVVPILERSQDEYGLCSALRLRAWVEWIEAHANAAAGAWEQAAAHARRAGAEHERIEMLCWVATSLFLGPTPVQAGVRRCEDIRAEADGNLAAVAHVLQSLAGLHAMEGRFDRARQLLATSTATLDELGLSLSSAALLWHDTAWVELLAGNPAAAEGTLRTGYAVLEEMGDISLLSTTAAYLAQALLAQGRDDDADEFARRSDELAAPDDLLTQMLWRGVRARTLARRGHVDEAERLAREAVELAGKTDFVNHKGDALIDYAIVLQQAGRIDQARAAFDEALRLYHQKGNVVAAERASSHLAGLPVNLRGSAQPER